MRVRDNQKEKLVRKNAIKLIVKEGLKGFSMQKLAAICGISVATLYIYYKNKEDLIYQLGIETASRFTREALKDFSPDMSFPDGLRLQWKNRARYALSNRLEVQFYDILRHSPYADTVLGVSAKDFKSVMEKFTRKAIQDKHLVPLPLEVYWSIAFGPLYSLIRFHIEKKSVGNRDFVISQEIIDQSLSLVLKALKP